MTLVHPEAEEEVTVLRRELDRQLHVRLERVEAELIELKERFIEQAHEIKNIALHQKDQAPALETINRMLQSGLVIRWMVTIVVGLLAALATAATSWETMQKWFK